MEVRLEALEGWPATPEDVFLSFRIGDVQKQSRFSKTRTFRFPEASHGRSRFGRLEVYKRVGGLTISFDVAGSEQQDVHVPCDLPGLQHLDMRVGLKDGASGKSEALPSLLTSEQHGRVNKRMDAAQRYMVEHRLEEILADAMREVLQSKPSDPLTFLSNQLLKHRKPRKESLPSVRGASRKQSKDAPTSPPPPPPPRVLEEKTVTPVSRRKAAEKLPPIETGEPMAKEKPPTIQVGELGAEEEPAAKSLPPPVLETPAKSLPFAAPGVEERTLFRPRTPLEEALAPDRDSELAPTQLEDAPAPHGPSELLLPPPKKAPAADYDSELRKRLCSLLQESCHNGSLAEALAVGSPGSPTNAATGCAGSRTYYVDNVAGTAGITAGLAALHGKFTSTVPTTGEKHSEPKDVVPADVLKDDVASSCGKLVPNTGVAPYSGAKNLGLAEPEQAAVAESPFAGGVAAYYGQHFTGAGPLTALYGKFPEPSKESAEATSDSRALPSVLDGKNFTGALGAAPLAALHGKFSGPEGAAAAEATTSNAVPYSGAKLLELPEARQEVVEAGVFEGRAASYYSKHFAGVADEPLGTLYGKFCMRSTTLYGEPIPSGTRSVGLPARLSDAQEAQPTFRYRPSVASWLQKAKEVTVAEDPEDSQCAPSESAAQQAPSAFRYRPSVGSWLTKAKEVPPTEDSQCAPSESAAQQAPSAFRYRPSVGSWLTKAKEVPPTEDSQCAPSVSTAQQPPLAFRYRPSVGSWLTNAREVPPTEECPPSGNTAQQPSDSQTTVAVAPKLQDTKEAPTTPELQVSPYAHRASVASWRVIKPARLLRPPQSVESTAVPPAEEAEATAEPIAVPRAQEEAPVLEEVQTGSAHSEAQISPGAVKRLGLLARRQQSLLEMDHKELVIAVLTELDAKSQEIEELKVKIEELSSRPSSRGVM